MIHGVGTVYRFVRQLLECDYCVCNLLSYLLSYMIIDCLEMPSDYDLSEHEDYIRLKYSILAKPFRDQLIAFFPILNDNLCPGKIEESFTSKLTISLFSKHTTC